MRIQGCTWLSSLFWSSVKRGWCFCMLLRASRSSRSTVSMSLLHKRPFNDPANPERETPPRRAAFPPDRKLIGHHDLVVGVGHQQPDGVLQDAFDELLLALPACAAAAPCWLLAGVVVLRGVDAPEVLAGVASLAAACGGRRGEGGVSSTTEHWTSDQKLPSWWNSTNWCRWSQRSCSRWSRSLSRTTWCPRTQSRRRLSRFQSASLPAAAGRAGRWRWTWRPDWTR